jgi:hypothetical protein
MGAAPSLSEWAGMSVESMSRTISLGVAPAAEARAGGVDGLTALLVDGVDDPEVRGVRGHTAEEVDLVAQGSELVQAVPAVSQHHGQVARHPAGVVVRAALPGGRHRP